MGFDDGQIILDNVNGAYYAGQTVYGRLVFEQDKVKTIHGIYVDFKGFCKVHWTTSHTRRVNDHQESYTVNHDSHEEYFRTKTFLFGDSSGEHHLQPGRHEFRFDCPIPVNCPSSFEGDHGHIRYRIKVVMVTSGIFSPNKDKMVAVRVFAPLDLNQNPYCKEPMEFELISSYCCWCISAGSSELLVKMPVGGYCPGQVIPMEVSCKNPSSVEIDEIKFAIKKDVVYHATSEPGTRTEHDTVAEIKKGPIPPGTTRNWTVEMEVPAMDIYNVASSRFIDINYHFKVSTEVSGCHEGTEEIRPIIFGTIPLVGFQDNIQNPLKDQLPSPMQAQAVQGANSYPPPPIVNQPQINSPYGNGGPFPNSSPYPGGNSPYPPGNQPFPNVSPYPANQQLPTVTPYPPSQQPGGYQANDSPYAPGNGPYPVPAGNSPYPPPQGNSPYSPPQGNSPYPPPQGNSIYSPPQGNSPYSPPQGNSPYPPPQGNSPYPPPQGNSPYPSNTPYSTDNSNQGVNPSPPFPGARSPSPLPPYPGVTNTTPLKTGTFGFTAKGAEDPASVPLLPPGANVPYPTSPPSNPYASASAPVPSTPGDETKPTLEGTPGGTSDYPPYNPEFMDKEKKNDEAK